MQGSKIRILIVDDAPTIRELLMDSLTVQPDFEVVAVASDGKQALELLVQHHPDVITLDLEMPRMDGLETLGQILALRPTPVIVVSSLAQRTAEMTLRALDRGALDFLGKPTGIREAATVFREELPAKIRNLRGADVGRILQYRKARRLRQQVADRVRQSAESDASIYERACIAIGVSTGGPPALCSLFAALQPPIPPIVVVQHMPPLFTESFAKRLDSVGRVEVKEAADGDELRPNLALVAPGGKHLRFRRTGSSVQAEVFDGECVSGHRPSIDVMMRSAAEVFDDRCLGLIMTGMGRDGAEGCKAIRRAGGYVIGQDEATSDVYGMNKVAFAEGGVDEQAPLNELPARIASAIRKIVGGSRWQPSCPPAHSTESKIELALSARQANGTGRPRSPASSFGAGHRFNLCVVDDDPAQLRLLMHRLKHVCPDQVALFGTSSPEEAMARIESSAVDLLVVDLVMPRYTGVDLLRELKRRNPCTQALIMTANADVESLLAAFELGAVDYLLKPVDPIQIERLIGEAVQRLARWRKALAGAFRFSQAAFACK